MSKGSSICVFLMALAFTSSSQVNPVLTIDNTSLVAGQIIIDASGHNYNKGLLSILPSVLVRCTEPTGNLVASSGSNTIPVGRFTAMAIQPSSPGTPGTTVSLSTTNQAITSAGLLGLLNIGGGDFSVRYSALNLSSFQWLAGNYSATLAYTMSGIGLLTSLTPPTVLFTVNVSPFITLLNEPGDIELLVNDLTYFRATPLLSTSIKFSHRYTVPLLLNIKSNTTLFNFSNGYSGITPPQTNISLVNSRITAPVQNPLISLTSTSQNLYSGAVPIGNTIENTASFSISQANLLAGFINKGTYATTLNLESTSSAYPATATNKTLNLRVIVSDLSELKINTPTVNLQLLTTEDYKNGVYQDITDHLVISKTTPYTVYVKADDANLKMGTTNTIPVSILTIAPTAPTPGVNTISSLSTTPQLLVNGTSPVIDRKISLRYKIDPTKVPNLLNKPAGTYTTTITYSFTAL
jgi:hypothetical protein